jgi:hypothetical protein
MTKKNKIKKHIIKQSKKVKIMYGGLTCDNPNNAAYMMVGHGGTLDSVLDVPDNCVYITTTLCGTLSSENNTFDWLFSHNKKVVKNPCNIDNFNEINRIISKDSTVNDFIGNVKEKRDNPYARDAKFLNMHISRATCETSASCPKNYLFQYKNAYYQPCSYWFYKDDKLLYESIESMKEKYNKIMFAHSGLISADKCFQQNISMFLESKGTPWKYPMLTASMIDYLYMYSLYPKVNDILKKIKEQNIDINSYLKITDPSDENYFDPSKRPILVDDEEYQEPFEEYIISVHDFVKLIIDNYSITQSELFRKFPGVHYNALCRGFHAPIIDLPVVSYLSKQLQRRKSVDNQSNILKLFEEEKNIADKENEEQKMAQIKEQTLLDEYSSITDQPPIYTFPRLDKITKFIFGRGKNKKTRKNKPKRYKNKNKNKN